MQPVDRVRQDLPGEAHDLLIVHGDALFQGGGAAREVGPQFTGHATAADGFAADRDDQQRGEAAAQGHRTLGGSVTAATAAPVATAMSTAGSNSTRA